MANNAGEFEKKRPKTGGRVAGTPNKTTVKVKDAILKAFDIVGKEKYLVVLAMTDPKTFASLLGRVLPTQISGPDDGPILTQVTRVIVRPDHTDG